MSGAVQRLCVVQVVLARTWASTHTSQFFDLALESFVIALESFAVIALECF